MDLVERMMKQAFEESLKAFDEGEVPIGAVIVKDGMVIGRGHNRIESLNDPTAHAEIIAISAASNTLKNWRLNGSTLYVLVEPCLMCGGAILQSRIDKVVYGVKEPKFGCFGTVTNILKMNKFNHQVIVEQTDFLREDIENLLIEFFRQKRSKSKTEKG